jgi:sugar phosphate isomerase/epimerase
MFTIMNYRKNKSSLSRRQFMAASGIMGAGLVIASKSVIGAPSILTYYGKSDSLIEGVQIGVITYSYRSLPDQSAEATLQYVLNSGINAIELMGDPAESFAGKPESTVARRAMFPLMRKQRDGDELSDDEKKQLEEMREKIKAYNSQVAEWRAKVSMDKFTQVRKMYNDAGVSIYAYKPNAFGENNTDAEVDYGFRAAKALGANQITLELPENDEHTKKLGEYGKKHKIYVAYHGHEQQTPTWWDTALGQSKYNAMNLDLGHYVAAGNPSPIDLIKEKHNRILSMHMKDRQTPENGKANLPFGQGDTPIIETLQLMRDQKYKFPATIELEYEVPEDSGPVEEVKKCLEYCKNALEK